MRKLADTLILKRDMAELTANDYLSFINETREKTLDTWAANVIYRWTKEMEYQNISDTSRLASSLRHKIHNASGGDKTKIVFTLLNYGRFVDLGVGRGEKYTKKKHQPIFRSAEPYPESPGYRYQVKPWFLPIFKQRVYSLARILERKYGEYAQLMIIHSISPDKFLDDNTNPL